MTFTIYLAFEKSTKIQAKRKADKFVKQGYELIKTGRNYYKLNKKT